MNKKGQVGVEYLSITAFLLAAVGIIFVAALATYYDASVSFAAKQSIAVLTNASDQVSGLGNGSELFVEVSFPDGVKSVNASQKTLSLVVAAPWGDQEYYSNTQAFLNPVSSFSFNAGTHIVRVRLVDGNVEFVEWLG
ncbi:MAG: hypothetical protein V1847_02960 [Candidatus Diapherotrites archaeon]